MKTGWCMSLIILGCGDAEYNGLMYYTEGLVIPPQEVEVSSSSDMTIEEEEEQSDNTTVISSNAITVSTSSIGSYTNEESSEVISSEEASSEEASSEEASSEEASSEEASSSQAPVYDSYTLASVTQASYTGGAGWSEEWEVNYSWSGDCKVEDREGVATFLNSCSFIAVITSSADSNLTLQGGVESNWNDDRNYDEITDSDYNLTKQSNVANINLIEGVGVDVIITTSYKDLGINRTFTVTTTEEWR